MNLVQIQERLKDLPTQALMQIANGGSPIAPPYLALGELKRRESIMQSAQGQQAMQQGRQPSVKEQVEQAAGLAGLQKQMQAQGMQSLMAQARPQGIPQNIPQPERQGESEGVAGLPTGEMYNFRNGGIVAFAAGDLVSDDDRVMSVDEMRARYKQLLRANKPIEAGAMLDRIKRFAPEEYRTVKVPVVPMDDATQRVSVPQITQAQGAVPEIAPVARSTPEQYATAESKFVGDPQEILRGIMAIPDPVERAAALDSLKRPAKDALAPSAAPTPSMPVAPAGIASIPGADEGMKMMLETMRAKPTLEAEATEAEKARGLFGLTQPYGEERMKRIQEMQAARQQELEPRGMERLMRVMGGIAGRGLAGAGPAYLQSMESERAADAAFRKQMDELLGGVEEARRKEAMGTMTDTQKRKARKEEMAIGAAEKIMDADTKFKLQELQAKAAMGRLSAEEQYILSEIQKGKSYPDIVGKIAEAKAGPRSETAEQQRFKDTYLKVAKAYDDMMIKPKDISRDEYIRREVDKAMGNAPIAASTSGGIPQQAIDYLKKNPGLAAQFDAKYGAGASAKYLGQ